MRRAISAILSTLAVIVGGFLFVGDDTRAQSISNSTYAAVPPFVSANTIPNVLLMMDNSGSMTNRGCEATSPACGILPSGAPSTTANFGSTTRYSGLFNPLSCYNYVSGQTRFEIGTAKATVGTACPATEWDGNLLNWITLRRFDAIQIAMMGGVCAVARDAAGLCPASGSPAKITLKGLTIFDSTSRGHETTPAVPLAGVDGYVGRMPTALAQGAANIYFHLRGGQSGMQGTFCIDDDNTDPSNSNTACNRDGTSNDSDAFIEGIDGVTNGPAFSIRVEQASEPQGVIQQVGNQARFGLEVFNSDSDGGRVLVGIGMRQSIDYNATTVETFNTNTAAMIDAIEEAFPNTWTPLAESVYDAVTYVAQVNSAFHSASYAYPLAYSPGLSMGGSNGVGRIGAAEITALVGSESCPSGYISNACGRDPYFFGGNHTPAWASPSAQVSCCQTFLLVLTDGEPTQDDSSGIPSAIRDYAHSYHGTHCTGGSGTIHAPNGTCNTNTATPAATLLGEHKTDYADNGRHYLDDVAFFAHTVDLRQATIPVIGVSGHDISGTQNVTVYTFFAFGNIAGREILMHAAKQGGFDDVNANGIPDTGEWDKVNNATGAAGSDGIPDTYFESANVDELRNKLTQTLSSILQRSTSGTSLSVLATSTTGEGALYQSFFFPKVTEGLVNVYWIGYTQALFLDTFGNLREDTNGDGRLVYTEDLIVRTRYDGSTGEVKADLFADTSPSPDGDGKADNPSTPTSTIALKDIKPVWEAGKKLALRDDATTPRKILTWLDLDNDGLVDSGEEMSFASANESKIRPYIRAADSGEGTDIINWIRGRQVVNPPPGRTYRNRELTVSGSTKTWKYGDTIHSTPTVVAAPRERNDIVYGDTSYSAFFKQFRSRRQVAYVGGNDGMLHAFNAGFYNPGDDPTTTSKIEHGWFTTQKLTSPFVTNTPAIGEELWAFIPQGLLPQLKFLTQGDYQHVYYVDQKPKITDARIFCGGTDPSDPQSPNCVNGQTGVSHPGGWGTILVGSFRLGGSCTNCSTSNGKKLTVTADFSDPADGDTTDPGDTRDFLSSYFALDITDPEVDPKLLWVFNDPGLGLTLGYPTMARLRPSGGDKTTNSDARWFMAVGSGPTDYSVGSVQTANLYVVDIVKKATSSTLNTAFYKFPTISTCGAAAPNNECSLIGNVVSVDTDLDYRADVFYYGNMICNSTGSPCFGDQGSGTPAKGAWKGRFYRLTTGSTANPALGTETDPCGWGVGSACARTPSVLLDDFACTGVCIGANDVGPVSAASNVAQDDANKIWVYWGTGRYFANADKTNADIQHFFGVKDLLLTGGCTQSSATACEEKDLVNVSNAEICVIGTTTGSGTCDATNQVTNVTGADGFDSSSGTTNTLQSLMQSKDGWYTTLDDQNAATPTRERSLSQPAIIGGLIFFPSFEPDNNICSASGSSFLYALYYKSGTAYKESVIGTVSQGSNTNVARRQAIGDPGLASGVAVHMGAQGSGGNGSGGGGCQGQLTANIQSSTGSVGQTCMKTAGVPWSYYISWTSQRDS